MSVDVAVKQPTEVLKAVADPVRGRIVELLATEELCVCHLTEALGVAQPLVSHHLRILREAGVVDSERFRYWTYYRLRPEALDVASDRLHRMAAGTPPAGSRRRPCC